MPTNFRLLLALNALILLSSFVESVIKIKGNESKEANGFEDTSTGKFQVDCIKWHNYYRKRHGAPPLKHSAMLEDYARYRAVELASKDGTNFYHPDDLEYGENLAWNSIERVSCKIPIGLWYDEWKLYNFTKPNTSSKNGHFTQVVWRNTERIGCGQAISHGKVGGTFTVCNYDPPGNYINEELENVFPAKKYIKKSKTTGKPKSTRKPSQKKVVTKRTTTTTTTTTRKPITQKLNAFNDSSSEVSNL